MLGKRPLIFIATIIAAFTIVMLFRNIILNNKVLPINAEEVSHITFLISPDIYQIYTITNKASISNIVEKANQLDLNNPGGGDTPPVYDMQIYVMDGSFIEIRIKEDGKSFRLVKQGKSTKNYSADCEKLIQACHEAYLAFSS